MFAIEGFLPLLVFYGTLTATGLATAIVASTAVCAGIVVWELRRGHDVGVGVVTLVFLLIQAAVGLAAQSTTVYLAQPVVLSALWGIAYLGSVAVGRPLIGSFANAWYPFPPWFRASEPYRREFAHAVARLGRLLPRRAPACGSGSCCTSGVGGFVLVSVATGTPVLIALVAWGIWHARRAFVRVTPLEVA